MGMERVVIAAKVSEENRAWLEYLKASFFPFEITNSGLINSLLTVVRLMSARNQITLTPESLQLLLRKDCVLGLPSPFPLKPGLPGLPEAAGPKAATAPDITTERHTTARKEA